MQGQTKGVQGRTKSALMDAPTVLVRLQTVPRWAAPKASIEDMAIATTSPSVPDIASIDTDRRAGVVEQAP